MTVGTASRFLDLRALSALERMRFTTRRRMEGAYSGRHRSRHRSGSGEFVDYREYSPGEDLRKLDWKVYGRTGKTYLRVYEDETDVVCTLAVDISGSMSFGGHEGDPYGSKLEYMQYLTTALSHIISHGQDQVGLAVLGPKLEEFIPPGSTADHVVRMQRVIEGLKPVASPLLAPGLESLATRLRRRGVILLISDFLFEDPEEVFGVLRRFRHRQCEVVTVHLIHPEEESLPEGPAFRFEGLELDGSIDCTPNEIRRIYEQKFSQHLAAIRTLALATGCDYRRVSITTPWVRTLQEFLTER